MSTPGWSVQRYKQIIDEAASTVEAMRARDRDRAADLGTEVRRAEEAAAEAARRERRVRDLTEQRWQSATKALWNQRWLAVKPFPEPEPLAHNGNSGGADLAEIEAEIERAHRALLDGVDRQPLLRRRPRS